MANTHTHTQIIIKNKTGAKKVNNENKMAAIKWQ